jgi:hypothetical protein
MPGMNNIKACVTYKFMFLQLECINLDPEATVQKEPDTVFGGFLQLSEIFKILINAGSILTLSIRLLSCSFSWILNKYKA